LLIEQARREQRIVAEVPGHLLAVAARPTPLDGRNADLQGDSVISRIGKWKPTAAEFFTAMSLTTDARCRWWSHFKTLRRRGVGQKSAAIAVSIAMDRSKIDVATALGCAPRRARRSLEKVLTVLGLDGPCALAVWLDRAPSTVRGKRRKATPQERPFARPVPPRERRTEERQRTTAPEARSR